jgi:hypothetical protein
VQLSIFMMAMEGIGMGNLSSIRAMRTLRALRPLRAVSRWEGMRVSIHPTLTRCHLDLSSVCKSLGIGRGMKNLI